LYRGLNWGPAILPKARRTYLTYLERAHFIEELARQSLVGVTAAAAADAMSFGGNMDDQPLVQVAYFASMRLATPTRL